MKKPTPEKAHTKRRANYILPDECRHGHLMAGNLPNVGIRANGTYRCLECHADDMARRRARKRDGDIEHKEAVLGSVGIDQKAREEQKLESQTRRETVVSTRGRNQDVLAIRRLANELGIHPTVIRDLQHRSAAFSGDVPAAENYTPTTNQVIEIAEDRRYRALRMIDDSVLYLMPADKLMKLAKDSTDIIQLLKGEPTTITRQERLNMIELGPELAAEMKRRSLTIDAKAVDITETEPGQ